MEAQVAFEFLVITGIVLAFLTPIWIYASSLQTRSSDQLDISLAQNAASKLTNTADLVASQGMPAQAMLDVYMPAQVANVSIIASTIDIKVNTFTGVVDAVSSSNSQLNGSLPAAQGSYQVLVQAKNGYVQIGLAS